MENKIHGEIALVSAPWPLFNRPSIQLGALKWYLENRFPELKVRAFHSYLEIAQALGYDLYRTISERSWLAETVYAALLYPDRFGGIEKIFARESSGKPALKKIDLGTLAERAGKAADDFIDNID